MSGADLVGVVERAYGLEGGTEAWFRGVLEAALPLLDRGLGLYGCHFDVVDPAAGMRLAFATTVGFPEDYVESATRLVESAPADMVALQLSTRLVCATASEATTLGERLESHPIWQQYAHPFGMHDSIGIRIAGVSPTQGFMVYAGLPRVEKLSERVRHTWEQVAAHIAAGFRLRQALNPATGDPTVGAEAILNGDGRLEHAEPAAQPERARQSLRRAVLDMAEARGPLRQTEPEAALDLWKGLVSGRWSLIDHFESSGRRYLVARRNDPQTFDPRSLTPREKQVLLFVGLGHSNKLIAYELGLGPSTVATHIGHLKEKLGAQTRTQLIALARGIPLGR